MSEDQTRCGSACILGLANAGKSTLVNQLVGQKVSIVSHKAQTTRSRVLGIALHEDTQIMLLDTPGIFDAKKTLEKAMVAAAYDALEDADCVVHLVDISLKNPADRNAPIFKHLREKLPQNMPVILVLNKIDAVKKDTLLKLAGALNEEFEYKATYMISALKGHGTRDVLNGLKDFMPASPWMFEEDEVTDMPMRLMAAEITREKIFNQLHQELPQSTFVETEEWEDFDNGSLKISQLVYVHRDSQKAIVLGKGGQRIKQIGQDARVELEELLQRKIHLKLFVKVQKDWSEHPEILSKLGLSA